MKTFTLKELCDKCAELMPEYLEEPGLIYFDFYVTQYHCARVSFTTMANSDIRASRDTGGRYFCDNICEDKYHAFIELKPVE